MSRHRKQVSELKLPRGRGDLGCLTGIVLIVIVFGGFAIYLLFFGTGIAERIPAILWLGIVFFGLRSSIQSAGSLRFWGADLLTSLGGHPILESDGFEIRLVQRMGRLRLLKGKATLESILSVSISLGQASGMTGKDQNDWGVSIWYRFTKGSHGRPTIIRPDEGLSCLPGKWPRGKAEALAGEVVEFLKSVGVPFEEREQEATQWRVVRDEPKPLEE